jgi:hypothetical protein
MDQSSTGMRAKSAKLAPVRIPDEPRAVLTKDIVSFRKFVSNKAEPPDLIAWTTLPLQLYPKEYEGHFESLMITQSEILNRIKVLAHVIHEDYKGQHPVMVCVLKGANPVSSRSSTIS